MVGEAPRGQVGNVFRRGLHIGGVFLFLAPELFAGSCIFHGRRDHSTGLAGGAGSPIIPWKERHVGVLHINRQPGHRRRS